MTINWRKLAEEDWKSSDSTAPVTVGEEIDQLIGLLEHVSTNYIRPKVELYGHPMMNVTYKQLEKDKLDSRELLGLLANQLKVHRYCWRVLSAHKTEASTSYLFETFVMINDQAEVRYLKIKFPQKGNPLKCPTNLEVIHLDYHVSKQGLKRSDYDY